MPPPVGDVRRCIAPTMSGSLFHAMIAHLRKMFQFRCTYMVCPGMAPLTDAVGEWRLTAAGDGKIPSGGRDASVVVAV
jgi:hypothetical protein